MSPTRFFALSAPAAILLAFLLSPPAFGGGELELEKLFVSEAGGRLEVAPDGSVASVTVEEGIEEPLRSALAKRIGALRFEPIRVAGKPVRALTGFHVDLVGRPQGEAMSVAIDGIDFATPKGMTAEKFDGQLEEIVGAKMDPPIFPREQMLQLRMARLKLALRIDAEGRVADLAVVDAMLIDTGTKRGNPEVALRAFEKAATLVARKWRFKVPADAASRSARDMTGLTRVEFVFDLKDGGSLHKPGHWWSVQRAPKRAIAWLPAEESSKVVETAVAAGGVSGGSNTFRLTNAIAGTPVL